MARPASPAHTFIVRIRQDRRENGGAASEWRGQIEHVPSGRTVLFRRLESIPPILREMIQPAGPP